MEYFIMWRTSSGTYIDSVGSSQQVETFLAKQAGQSTTFKLLKVIKGNEVEMRPTTFKIGKIIPC